MRVHYNTHDLEASQLAQGTWSQGVGTATALF
jgi:hypothetical protein